MPSGRVVAAVLPRHPTTRGPATARTACVRRPRRPFVMNLLELRYFVAVARHQSIHRAAKEMHVSPATISKAVARLEDELAVMLLVREGGKIRSNEAGVLLARRATALLHLEEAARAEIMGRRGSLHVVLGGPEVLLLLYRQAMTRHLKAHYPDSLFEFRSVSEEAALAELSNGTLHVAI